MYIARIKTLLIEMCRGVMLHVTDKIQPNQSLPFKFSVNVAQKELQEDYARHISKSFLFKKNKIKPLNICNMSKTSV